MSRSKENDGLWNDIYDLDCFTDKSNPHYDKCWHWAEKLQSDGKLRGVDIICLKGLLDAIIASTVHEQQNMHDRPNGDE